MRAEVTPQLHRVPQRDSPSVALVGRALLLLGIVGPAAGCETPLATLTTRDTPPRGVGVPELTLPILGTSTQAGRDSIVRFFAPVIYQEVNNSERDFLTRVSFDGDWQGSNNWANAVAKPKPAYVYVSLVEDANRYFIHYETFHPSDWCSGAGPIGGCLVGEAEHENDMEGVKFVVDKRFVTAQYPFGQIIMPRPSFTARSALTLTAAS